MRKPILRLALTGALFLSLCGCSASTDVTIAAPDLTLDTTNAVMKQLAAALPQHPEANSFSVNWNIVPNPTRPSESIPHLILYDRKKKTLEFYRDTPRYDQYSGVTDALLKTLATQNESLPSLVSLGCKVNGQDLRKKDAAS